MISRKTSRTVSVPGIMAALLFLYAFHPVAGWALLVILAALTAGWHRRHAVRVVEA